MIPSVPAKAKQGHNSRSEKSEVRKPTWPPFYGL